MANTGLFTIVVSINDPDTVNGDTGPAFVNLYQNGAISNANYLTTFTPNYSFQTNNNPYDFSYTTGLATGPNSIRIVVDNGDGNPVPAGASITATVYDGTGTQVAVINGGITSGTDASNSTYFYATTQQFNVVQAVGPQGTQGPQGSAGTQGTQGPQGSNGAQGTQGPQGTAGTQGTQGPQGTTGAQGTQGPQGTTGAQGTQGPQGTAGTQGTQGPQGTTGAQGTQGPQGTDGTQGTQGPQGTDGTQGTQGPQGTTGAQGTQGPQGTDGTQGTQGPQGTDGTQGTQGPQGTTGAQGTQGAQGAAGTQGAQGAAGTQGAQGTQGTAGTQGTQGAQGAAGTQGTQGAQGAAGTQGAQGAQGATGTGTQGAQGAMGAQGPQGAKGAAECFVAGTRIATPDGARAIEDLVVGDLVVTIDGAAVPVRWIGRRRLQPDLHPRPAEVRPVRIAAHAFGEGLPTRDLVVSPGHGLFVRDAAGEHLIPAVHLVNGTTIVQEAVAAVDYVHVELDQHDILLAEGLPAESYLDVGNRAEFENGDGPMVLHPAFAPLAHEAARAPFVITGPVLEAIRGRLAERAQAARPPRTGDARVEGLRARASRG